MSEKQTSQYNQETELISKFRKFGNFIRHHPKTTTGLAVVGISASIAGGIEATDHQPANPYMSEQYENVPKATEEILDRFEDPKIAALKENPSALHPEWSDGVERTPLQLSLDLKRNVDAVPYMVHYESQDAPLEWGTYLLVNIQRPDGSTRERVYVPSVLDPEHAMPELSYQL